jgi:hypothetical protein
MESKKINQLATEMAPATSDLTIIGDPITGVSKKITLLQIADLFATTGTVTSVAVTETGDALTITGSPITSAGTINIGFAGDATQYVRGDGALADFPTSTGGGSSVSYYLNSSVSQGTIGGVAYRELSKDPIAGAGTDITVSTNGYIASYITDANDPALLEVPAGNFNCEFYFSVNSNAHNPYVYAEVYKYDGTTFTLIGSSQSVPEYLTNGTTLSPYYFAIPVTQTTLAITDRIAIRIYVNVDTRVVTLHTENNHLCQVVTTFSKGLTSLNNLTRQVQFLATGTSGTDFAISSSTATHTFNLPVASATNTGKLSSTDWSTFNAKQPAIGYTPANDSLVVHLAGSETITGNKFYSARQFFENFPIYSESGISLDNRLSGTNSSNSTTLCGNVNGLQINLDGGGYNSLNFASTSVGNTYTFPNATGTLALTTDLGSYLPLAGGTMTGQIVLKEGTTSSDYTKGLRFPNDPYGGASDTSGLRLYADTSAGTEAQILELYCTNDSVGISQDKINLSVPNIDFAMVNGNKIWNAGNLINPIKGTGTRTINYLPLFSGSDSTIENSSVYEVFSPEENIGVYVANTLKVQNALVVTGNINAVATTLTGALSGTSATFSSSLQNTGLLKSINTYVSDTTVYQKFVDNTGLALNFGGTASGFKWLEVKDESTGSYTSLLLNPRGGNVGIGTSSPTDFGSTYTTLCIDNATNGGVLDLRRNGVRGLTIAVDGSLPRIEARVSGEPLVFSTNNAGTVSERMRITSGGNFDYGGYNVQSTNNATYRQAFYGALSLMWRNGGDWYFNSNHTFSSSNTNVATYGIASGIGRLSGSGGDLGWETYDGSVSAGSAYTLTTKFTIKSSGSVLIGITTNSASARLALDAIGMAVYDGGNYRQCYMNGSTMAWWNGSNQGTLSSAGVWTDASDISIKKDVKDIEYGLDAVLKLKPRSYKMKEDDLEQVGFIAQEVEQVIKELVSTDNKGMKGLSYGQLTAILTKAIQEQQAQIEELKQLILNK